jgi:cation:H+ antiporter
MESILLDVLLFAAGLLILLKGASLFTDNASKIAKSIGVSDIVIGLTLVAFTTSLPELAVSVTSVLKGSEGIALGNIVGSNIANVGLVLGIAALLTPGIKANRNEIKQGYIMILVTLAAVLFMIDGLTPMKGIILIISLFFYVYYLSRDRELRENIVEKIMEKGNLPKGLLLCIVGGAAVLFGAQIMVSSSINIASGFNVSETLIGLTIVAVGTSLPELATSLTAAFKKLQGIALGNIIGSNVFNLLMVMGASALSGAAAVGGTLLYYSVPMMMLLSLLLVLFMKVENRLGRLDGAALLSIYSFFIYLKFFVL